MLRSNRGAKSVSGLMNVLPVCATSFPKDALRHLRHGEHLLGHGRCVDFRGGQDESVTRRGHELFGDCGVHVERHGDHRYARLARQIPRGNLRHDLKQARDLRTVE